MLCFWTIERTDVMPNYKNLAKCPYFLAENQKSITCEDVIRRFSSEDKKDTYADKYCNTSWEECPYARDLNDLYDTLDVALPELKTEILLRQRYEATRAELNKTRSLLGRAEKKVERLSKK